MGPHYHLIKNLLLLAMIELKNCCVGVEQQSLTHLLSVGFLLLKFDKHLMHYEWNNLKKKNCLFMCLFSLYGINHD